eukprot:187357_1
MSLSAAEIIFYLYIPLIITDIGIFARLLYKLYIVTDESNRKISSVQQMLNLICFSAVIFCSLCDMLHAFGSMITNENLLTNTEWILIFHTGADVFYYMNTLTLYIILVHRLYTTFKNSMFQISIYLLSFITIFIFLQAVVMLSYCLNVAIFNCDPKEWCDVLGIQSAIITANDYILNGILFILFIKKLRQLVLMRVRYDSITNFTKDKNNENNQNIKLLNVITKQSIIGVSLTLANQAFATAVFISFTWGTVNNWDKYLMIDYLSRGVEGVCVCCLLYLGLHINNDEYMKTCKYCHNACYNCCVPQTKKQNMDVYYAM